MRIVVLWNACRGVTADEDARWVEQETARLAASNGVARVAVHQVESAALLHPRRWDWCLELHLAGRERPNTFVRSAPCAEFLSDLRMLGTHPTVFVLPGEAS